MNAKDKKNQIEKKYGLFAAKRLDKIIALVDDWTEYCWDGHPITLSADRMDSMFVDHLKAVEVLRHRGYNVVYYHKKVYKGGKYISKVMYDISL